MNTVDSSESWADCTIAADGRITFVARLPSAARPQLLLRLRPKKGQPETTCHLLDLEPVDDGRRSAVLHTRPVLAEGRWDVFLLQEPGGERRKVRPGPRDLRALVDGHARDWPSPVAVRVPYVTKDGHLAIRAWLRTVHAEADRIRTTTRSMTVTARLHGTSFSDRPVVRLRLRGTSTVRDLHPRVEDDRRTFSFTVDWAELADQARAGGVWDLFVRPAAGASLTRIGRLLDDVADRKEIFVYPAVPVGTALVRPYYTVDNDLSLEVTQPDPARGA
ncbi:transferase [Streptomyces sp. Tue6028]|uniref:transferase n=1 Tax=Streptomyces sp. Tue6028 TaxID=2036037 RepID=UPI003D734422